MSTSGVVFSFAQNPSFFSTRGARLLHCSAPPFDIRDCGCTAAWSRGSSIAKLHGIILDFVAADVTHELRMLYLSVVTKVWVSLSYEPLLSLWLLSIHPFYTLNTRKTLGRSMISQLKMGSNSITTSKYPPVI